MPKKNIILLLSVSILFQSCFTDKFDPIPESFEISPLVAIPIVSAKLNIERSLLLLDYDDINTDSLIATLSRADTIHFIDTLSFSLNDIGNEVDMIRFLEFKLFTWNDFPTSANVQLHFIDSLGNRLETLFSPAPLTIEAGVINSNGTVAKRGESFETISINANNIENIIAANRIILNGEIIDNSAGIIFFEYYLNYYLTIKLSARLGFDLTLE